MEYIGHLFKHFNTARVAAITLPSDDRSFVDNQAKCEGAGRSNVCVSYHALSEDWSEIADRTINILEKIIENCAIRGIAFQELNGFFVSGNFILMCRTVHLLVARLQKFFVCSLCGKILPQIVNLLIQQL